ncbi:hypothetical protein BH24BAC1_BH24BAC1_33210 [soil metagenome]
MKQLILISALALSGFLYKGTLSSAAPFPSSSESQTQDLRTFFLPAPALTDPLSPGSHPTLAKTDSLLAYAKKLIGQPYVYGDIGKQGFECSGFTSHVFSKFGISISRSSSTQAQDGQPISRSQARKGDLIIFTGTNPALRTPGHVGIILSDPGEPISFVHSSSVGGVKISEVESTGYENRFLEVRRVL